MGPNCDASIVETLGVSWSTGGAKRRSPTGGCAKGISANFESSRASQRFKDDGLL